MKLSETIYQILVEETYAEEYKSFIHREQVRNRMRVISEKIANKLMVKFEDVEKDIENKMSGKIIKGNLNGQEVAEQWINVNNAILIAKQILYKHYNKISVRGEELERT